MDGFLLNFILEKSYKKLPEHFNFNFSSASFNSVLHEVVCFWAYLAKVKIWAEDWEDIHNERFRQILLR
jgi:lipopolysaccharide biosynthesis glycosyltransferase